MDPLKLNIPLTTLDDDLHYEAEGWEDQTHNQDDQGEVEMFHCQWLNFLLLFFLFEWSLIYQQTSLDLTISNCEINTECPKKMVILV